MRLALALAFTLLLVACAEPRAACLRRANAELRALDAAVAETELALARSYRVAPGSTVTAGLAICAEDSPLTLCLSGERPISERRTAIDPAEERARLRALMARRPAVAAEAERASAACPAA
ncbi:MAG: hypothetical protein OEM24_02270 [Paracoccaceae bacterium]|nr:hypothetical protein [Paracoccaceae bacterium]